MANQAKKVQESKPVVANEKAYTELMAVFVETVRVDEEARAVQEAKQGNYNACVHAGSLCASLEEWNATAALIKYNITHNIDGAAKKVKAEEREKPTEDGAAYTMPRSITNAMSVIQFAWQKGVKFNYVDKKDNKEKLVTFGMLRAERTLKVAKEKERDAARLPPGIDKDRHECRIMLAKLAEVIKSASTTEANIKTIHSHLLQLVGKPKAVKAIRPTAQAKPARKAASKPKDVGDELSQVA
jgi:hypothetical protein